MKVKRSSWHYKLGLLGDTEPYNDNLCRYFWRLVGRLAIFLVFLFLALYVPFFVGYLVYLFCVGPFISNVIMASFVVLSIALSTMVIKVFRKKLGKPIGTFGENNIVVEYIKAKKRKVCPIIEYVD